MTWRLLHGDCREVLRSLRTPEEYIEHLQEVFRELHHTGTEVA